MFKRVALEGVRVNEADTDPSEVPSHPLFAAVYDHVTGHAERTLFAEHRRYLTRNLRGAVLDLGAGTGATFPYLKDAATESDSLSLHAVEPDPHMRSRAKRRAESLALDVDIRAAKAESLPYDDETFDAVIAAVVFCTIPNPERALSEAHRVLKPGGEFRFLEHVQSDGLAGRLQDVGTPAWKRVAAGCHLNRRTAETIRDSELELVDLDEFDLGVFPVTRFVRGTAVKRR